MRRYGHDRQPIQPDHARPARRNPRSAAGIILGAALFALPLVAASEPRPGFVSTSLDLTNGSHAIRIGSDGLPVIAYLTESTAPDFSWGSTVKVAHCEDLACTVATLSEIALSQDGASGAPRSFDGISLTIGPDGFPLISYIDLDGGLSVAHCADVACSSATISPSLLSSYGPQRLSSPSMTIGSDGLGLISVWNRHYQILYVAHCEDADCSTATISYAGNQAGGPGEITIGSDGLGIMSYVHVDGSLRTAHCQTANCTSSQGSIVDQTEGRRAGKWNSITIGTDGLPLIAYESADVDGWEQMRVAHCNDVFCTSSTRTVVLGPSPGGSKDSPSIAIGADGLGVIAYYGQVGPGGQIGLGITHCSNVACEIWLIDGPSCLHAA